MSIDRPYVLGTGSFVPDTRLTNDELLGMYPDAPKKPNGEPITGEWIERIFGIKTRALDIDSRDVVKRPREEGGLYDGDYTIKAAQCALDDAGVKASEIDVLVHVSCTPDTIVCGDHFRFITTQLGLRPDVHLVHHNLGCAGLGPGIKTAFTHVRAGGGATTALLVASNCPSGHMSRESLGYYVNHPHPWGWSSPAVFGDGAGAVVMRLNGDRARGLLGTSTESDPDYPLVTYGGAGCLKHSRQETLWDHIYLMDAALVGNVFVPLMQRDYQLLCNNWERTTEGEFGAFDPGKVVRWYFHQANAHMVRQAAQAIGVPLDRVPIIVDTMGNSSAPSTLIMFDQDRRAGRVKEKDLVVFMWIGAGNGAMNGYATLIV